MKAKILLLLLALETSLPAIPTILQFSGTVTVADSIAESHGFGVGHEFIGALSYDPEAWNAGTPLGNRGAPRLAILDSIWATSGNFNNFIAMNFGSDVDFVSFTGECSLLNFLSINLTHSKLSDWISGEVSAICTREFSFGNWQGEITMPSPQAESVPDGGATASMLAVAMVGLLLVSVQGQSRPG